MKIVHLSYSDLFGGAARSAYNIHKSLVSVGLNSKMIVVRKESKDKNILEIENFWNKYFLKVKNYLLMFISKLFYDGKSSFNFFSNSFLVKKINSYNPDYIFFHWIHAEMISVEDLQKIKAKKIFVLHDMWWIGSHEHYFNEKKNINHFKNNLFSKIYSFSKFNLDRKRKIKLNNIVAPSQWLLDCAKKKLPNKRNFKKITYGLNLKNFKPEKNIKNKSENKNIKLLFVGFGKVEFERKGIDLLIKILSKIKEKNIELTIIGDVNQSLFQKIKIDVKFISKVSSDKKLNKIYNNNDILLFTSRQDNLPNVVLEAMSTGLPVIAFKIGGLKDLIKNNFNGYLCKPFNLKQYSKKLNNLILDKKTRQKFSLNSINYSKKNFDFKNVGNQYLSYINKIKS